MKRNTNKPLKRGKVKVNKEKKARERRFRFNYFFKGVFVELESRIGSSIKRIVKFIGVSLIPIIYAITCILAFWNPVQNIGHGKAVFVDQEQEVLVASSNDIKKWDDKFLVWKNDKKVEGTKFLTTLYTKQKDGKTYSEQHYGDNADDAKKALGNQVQTFLSNNENDNFEFSAFLSPKNDPAFGPYITASASGDTDKITLEQSYRKGTNYIYYISLFDILLQQDFLMTKDNNTNLEKQTYYTNELTDQKIKFTNMHYERWQNNGKSDWQGINSFIQLKINQDYLSTYLNIYNYFYSKIANNVKDLPSLIKFLKNIYEGNDITGIVSANPLQIWTTHARNFLYGYYIETIDKFKEALPAKMVAISLESLGGWLKTEANFPFAKDIGDILEGLGITNGISNLNNAVKITIQGSEHSIYGIGLGEFFLLIGMYVGTLMNTFIYDRAKRFKKLTPAEWYLSKTVLMLITCLTQVTLLTLAVTAAGWWQIGAARLFELWGVLLVTEIAFVCTIQGLWFSLKDETIGKFICIIYLVLNLSSGWGTFPSFMQFSVFQNISHICEYMYSLHAIGTVIYGSQSLIDATYILQNLGILLGFALFFICLGLLLARRRTKEMYYGTYYKRHILHGLVETGHYEMADQFLGVIERKHHNIKVWNWKALPKEPMYDLIEWVRENAPYEHQFKRFKNKVHDDILTPNPTDDDIMSRNDEIRV